MPKTDLAGRRHGRPNNVLEARVGASLLQDKFKDLTDAINESKDLMLARWQELLDQALARIAELEKSQTLNEEMIERAVTRALAKARLTINGTEVMSREVFIRWKPHAATLVVVEQANSIIEEYQAQGFALTLRQLFYQFVSRGQLENRRNEYKRLGIIVRNARDGGMVDWDAIEDRTREVNTHSAWGSPADVIRSAANSYQLDLWDAQRYRPEVWIEKDALLGVIEGVCTEYRVLVLHLADHDPSGIDMTRDNIERLRLYARDDIEVCRVALNMDQVEQYNPPPNFVKEKDSLTAAYREQFGTDECWELDALSPTVIAELIRKELVRLVEPKAWSKTTRREKRDHKLLEAVATNWAKVEKLAAAFAK